MLIVHRAERADRLVHALAEVLAEPLDDPFAAEVVAVPSRGIERWLGQQLSNVLGATPGRADGVSANVDLPFPGRLVGRALHAATGIDPATDPWVPSRSVWPLLAVVDEHLDEAWMAALARHVGGDRDANADGGHGRDRRFGAVRHVADLFDRYEVHRPEMVVRWAAGDDVDGDGAALPADMVWQPQLWRRLRARIGVASPAERLGPACRRLRDEPALVDLPPRVALFGLTRIAPSVRHVLDAVAESRDVHLLLLHPSPALWAHGDEARHPLLATWGRDARSMQPVLAGTAAPRRDVHHPGDEPPATLLGRLQAAVCDDDAPPGPDEARPLLDPGDDSLQIHACHGRTRQVEVLRDAILHLLADDPTLEPRDVVVMCPDIETFAPLIHATFGGADEAGPAVPTAGTRRLRVRLADRAVRQVNPVLAAVSALLDLAASRLTASQLVDFAGLQAVRRRFRLDDDALARIEEWVAATGVRWGLDAEHRAPFKLHVLPVNTWRAGLDRLLLGVSMTEDDLPLVGGALPLDDVDSSDIELAGRFAELVDRVGAAVTTFAVDRAIGDWAEVIAEAADALTAVAPDGAWQRAELDALLDEIATEAGDAPDAPSAPGTARASGAVSAATPGSSGTAGAHSPPGASSASGAAAADAATDAAGVSGTGALALSLAEVRALLGDELRGRPSRANFRTGDLTVCTLVPMRSVPHRVVGLLGLDDGAFPRHGAPDGDDLLLRDPRPGDHDVRTEDRQLLLDALLAAGEHVVVTYSGRDERTNAVRPPSVPIGELLDVVDATVATADGSPARHAVLTEHPLQPFDGRNFLDGALRRSGPWAFDPVDLAGAEAQRGSRRAPAPFLAAPLPPFDVSTVELDDLVRFVEHPTRAFLRRRLGITVGGEDDELLDAIPVELDGLAAWRVGDRLLAARLAGADWDTAVAAERVRGELPPGPLGGAVLGRIMPAVERIHAAVVTAAADEPSPAAVDVSIDVPTAPDGTTLAGTVTVRGTTLLGATYSTLGPKQRIAAWVRLLALSADGRTTGARAVTVGRRGTRAVVAHIPAIPADVAADHLRVLVDLYARGMREPLPLWCKTSAALASRAGNPRMEWETPVNGRFPNEDRDRDHVFVLGAGVPFARLLQEQPRPDECGPGWSNDASRATRYARRLWGPLLDVEQVEQ
ncbi:MAG: exodeoxyribonuclease V subunit gamma [Ilumatobacteraceae bacterium]